MRSLGAKGPAARNLARARSAAHSSPEGAGQERAARTAAGLRHSLPCTSCVAAAVTPTAICDAAPTICSQTRTHACLLRPIFCAFAPFATTRVCRPSPRGCRNGRQGRAAGFGHETPCVAQARLSRARSFKPRAIINSYAPIIMRSPLPPFWELAFVMPQRDSRTSALAPRLSLKARGLSKTQAADIPDARGGRRRHP